MRISKFLCLLLLAMAFTSCSDPCANTVLSEIKSPAHKWIVTVFVRDCGATTAPNTQVSLRDASEPFDYDKQPSFLILEGDFNITVSWHDETHLTVRFPKEAKVFKKETSRNGVLIDYISD